jgi:hypothetical protein
MKAICSVNGVCQSLQKEGTEANFRIACYITDVIDQSWEVVHCQFSDRPICNFNADCKLDAAAQSMHKRPNIPQKRGSLRPKVVCPMPNIPRVFPKNTWYPLCEWRTISDRVFRKPGLDRMANTPVLGKPECNRTLFRGYECPRTLE